MDSSADFQLTGCPMMNEPPEDWLNARTDIDEMIDSHDTGGGKLVALDGYRDRRPRIINGTEIYELVSKTIASLVTDQKLYQRDGKLVSIVAVQETMDGAPLPRIGECTFATLRERATKYADWVEWGAKDKETKKRQLVKTLPPQPVIAAALDRGEYPGIRPIAGIIETPSMRPDGELIGVPGYDSATGYVYIPRCEYPPIPMVPTLEDARNAAVLLREPWVDFPFDEEGSDLVAVAAMLTQIARPAIKGACPAILFDASTRGSGKSLQVECVSRLAIGRPVSLTSWPSDDTELEKVLGSYALNGGQLIAFDNLDRPFGGAPLDKVLSAQDRVDLRVLGQSTMPSLPWRAQILATGNNIVISGDTVRRALRARLTPTTERPEERTGFKIPKLAEWCTENHPRMVVAALTLLRGYIVAGSPDQYLPNWGSFDAWNGLIGSAIKWATGVDISHFRPTVHGDDDPETEALRTIVNGWCELFPDGSTIKAAIDRLYPALAYNEPRMPDKWEAMREAVEVLAPMARDGQPNKQKLGMRFGRMLDRVVDEKKLTQPTTKHGSKVWRVEEIHD